MYSTVKKYILFALLLMLCTVQFAQLGGQTAYRFLNIVNPARVASMGGNLIMVQDNDLALALINPSLLNAQYNNRVHISYANLFSGVNSGFLGYSKHIEKHGTFAGSFQYINYGKFTETNETGDKTGSFTAGDYALTASGAKQIDSLFSMGASIKVFHSSYYNFWSMGAAIDLSATYFKPSKFFCAAVILKNIGYQFKPYTKANREKFPFEIQAGISKKLAHAPFRFSLAFENIQRWKLAYIDPTFKPQIDPATGQPQEIKEPGFFENLGRHLIGGIELIIKNFNVRFAYNYRRRAELRYSELGGITGLSFGVGYKSKKFDFSYGLASYHLAGTTNHISIGLNLSELSSKN